ncbi:hypothetical protein F5B17DRAFT_420347 [Nemania serpens]|nr:hypothetical protein F5B17DRAFT_420347 [Nemania serpens]
MEPSDQDCTMSNNIKHKTKDGRTPLKQFLVPRPIAQPSTAPLKRTRKRIGGKRTVRSCTSCRAAHVRCVADRYGIPCERCAKKSWLDVSNFRICTYIFYTFALASYKIDLNRLESDSLFCSAPLCRSNTSRFWPSASLPT